MDLSPCISRVIHPLKYKANVGVEDIIRAEEAQFTANVWNEVRNQLSIIGISEVPTTKRRESSVN